MPDLGVSPNRLAYPRDSPTPQLPCSRAPMEPGGSRSPAKPMSLAPAQPASLSSPISHTDESHPQPSMYPRPPTGKLAVHIPLGGMCAKFMQKWALSQLPETWVQLPHCLRDPSGLKLASGQEPFLQSQLTASFLEPSGTCSNSTGSLLGGRQAGTLLSSREKCMNVTRTY